MSDQKNVTVNYGGFFLPVLTLIFVYFKLSGTIDWSWWLVFTPILAPVAIVLFVVILIAVIGAILK